MIPWDAVGFNSSAFKRARGYLNSQRGRAIAACFCAAISSICFALTVIVVGLLGQLLFGGGAPFDAIVADARNHWYGRMASGAIELTTEFRLTTMLRLIVFAIVLLTAVRALGRYFQTRWVASAVLDVTLRLRRAVYNQAYRLGTTEVSGIGAAPAINVFTREVEDVRQGLLAWLDCIVREPLKLTLLLVLAFAAHRELAGIFLVIGVLLWIVTRPLIARARARDAAATRAAAERLSLLQESLFMIRLTRGSLMESYEQQRFERNLGQFTLSEGRQLRSSAAVGPLVQLLVVLGVTLIVWVASFLLLDHLFSPFSTIVLYASLVSLFWPVKTLLDRFDAIKQGGDAAAALFTFLDQHAKLGQVAAANFLSPMSRTLEFANVRLQEPDQPPVLDGVNLRIRAGSRTAIMGLDDRAKRALVYLIPRFLDPTDGQVQIDGQDIRVVTLESLRAQVALVLQGELVFSDTVAGNIGCGDQSYGLPHIIDAAKIAHVHQFAQRLPKGYDTLIGDQGEPMSISQQFRIALARAILRDPTIVVIEEPRSPLDDDTKHLLDDTLSRFAPGRTVIFLPHRLSTIRTCDSIVLLHNGRVETIGNHKDLTQASELYRHLQYTEFNIFAAG